VVAQHRRVAEILLLGKIADANGVPRLVRATRWRQHVDAEPPCANDASLPACACHQQQVAFIVTELHDLAMRYVGRASDVMASKL
jgi:hypothetical protein